ncbi:MAG: SH3 domain-containing protein [Phocaeicola sp.]
MSNKKYKTNMTKPIDVEEVLGVTNTTIPEPIMEPEPIAAQLGKVINCKLLCMRQEPKSEAAVIRFLEAGTEVVVHADKSTDEWYAVTVDEVDGFCMKNYISI